MEEEAIQEEGLEKGMGAGGQCRCCEIERRKRWEKRMEGGREGGKAANEF